MNNQLIQDNLKSNYPDIEFLLPDLTYQDGIIEALKKYKPDVLIINMEIEGDLDKHSFIQVLRDTNDSVRIILITKTPDKEYSNWLVSKGVYDVFVDGQCSFDEIHDAINREQKVIVKKEVIIQKEVVQKEKVVTHEKVVKVSFKRLTIVVLSSTEFACEFSYCTARLSGIKTMLVNLDMLKGFLDIYLGIEQQQNCRVENIFREMQSGKPVDIAVLEDNCTKPLDNLSVLDLGYVLQQNKQFPKKEIQSLLSVIYCNFDLTIISLPWDSEYLQLIADISDYVLLPCEASQDEFMASLKLSERRLLSDIPPEKLLLTFIEYDKETDLPETYLIEQLGKNYLGRVNYDANRSRARNRDSPAGFYSSVYYPILCKQYTPIMERFDLYTLPSAYTVLKGCITKLFGRNTKHQQENKDIDYTLKDLSHSFNEASTVMKHITDSTIRATSKAFSLLLRCIKFVLKPYSLVFLLLLYILTALLGVDIGQVLQFLMQHLK